MADQFVKVAATGELPPGQMKLVEVGEHRVVLANVGGTFYAFGDECTHANGPLSEGVLEGVRVECPWHGSVFDVTTGRPVRPPARQPVPVYAVRLEGDSVLLAVPGKL